MAIKLNEEAFEFAKKLIQEGKINSDAKWSDNEPTAASEDAYLSDHDFGEYGLWYLAVNTDKNPGTKGYYEFPFGNFDHIYRSGVIAAEHRAGQYHHKDIEAAAKALLDLIDAKA